MKNGSDLVDGGGEDLNLCPSGWLSLQLFICLLTYLSSREAILASICKHQTPTHAHTHTHSLQRGNPIRGENQIHLAQAVSAHQH